MMVVVVAGRRSPAAGVALVRAAALLLACTAATGVVVVAATGNSSTICDTAKCGKGSCSEVPGIIPLVTAGYECNCDPGWSQPTLPNLTALPFLPCIIPDCTFDSSCYNFSLIPWPPRGIPLTDPCVVIDCGPGGECKKGDGFSYTWECHPGYVNFVNVTALPCVKNCSFGTDCSKLGIVPPPPAPPPTPSTAAPPPGPGSVSWWRLLQQPLSLAILLLHLHQVVFA